MGIKHYTICLKHSTKLLVNNFVYILIGLICWGCKNERKNTPHQKQIKLLPCIEQFIRDSCITKIQRINERKTSPPIKFLTIELMEANRQKEIYHIENHLHPWRAKIWRTMIDDVYIDYCLPKIFIDSSSIPEGTFHGFSFEIHIQADSIVKIINNPSIQTKKYLIPEPYQDK